jgi:hypothetical protein
MNPEDTYVSKVKGIPGGQIKIVWSVIWNMVPIIAAAPAIRDALHGKKNKARVEYLNLNASRCRRYRCLIPMSSILLEESTTIILDQQSWAKYQLLRREKIEIFFLTAAVKCKRGFYLDAWIPTLQSFWKSGDKIYVVDA